MQLPRFTDARGIARDLGGDPAYRRLATAISKAAVAQSCVSDLAQAQTCCAALDALLASPRKKGTIERSASENALLTTAALLYARATSTGGGKGERGPIDISSKLDGTQRVDHEALLDVRNRALAHVYSREAVANDIWHDDMLFLVETDQGWKTAGVTKRVQFHRLTLDRLHRQLPIGRRLITEIFHKHTNHITELMTANPVEMKLFESNLFDPMPFFGSERGVMNAVAGIPHGHAIGLI